MFNASEVMDVGHNSQSPAKWSYLWNLQVFKLFNQNENTFATRWEWFHESRWNIPSIWGIAWT